MEDDHIALWVDSEERERRFEIADVVRWWDVLQPADSRPSNPLCTPGAIFRPRKTMTELFGLSSTSRASIITAGPNWISYFNVMVGLPSVFRIVECETFEEHWLPDKVPTAWERLLGDDLI